MPFRRWDLTHMARQYSMHIGLHHLQQRKQPSAYPHPDPRVRALDSLVYFIGIVSPLIAVPQVIEVWVKHNAAGVSFFYWAAQTIGAFIWLTYGMVHKEKPIIITNAMWAALNAIVAVGVYIYR